MVLTHVLTITIRTLSKRLTPHDVNLRPQIPKPKRHRFQQCKSKRSLDIQAKKKVPIDNYIYSAASLSKFPEEAIGFNLVLLRGGVFGGSFLTPLT